MKFLLTIVLAFLLAATAIAQITIHSTDFPGAGFSFTQGNSAHDVTFSSGSAGANQTWTFGDYAWMAGDLHQFMAPASTPYGSSFPTATRAEHIVPNVGNGEDYYGYEQVTASTYDLLGEVQNDTIVTYTTPLHTALPITYGSTWTSVMQYAGSFGGFDVVFKDSAIFQVDGWGTVTTPYGSWPALRHFIHHWTSITRNGQVLNSFQRVGYSWLNQQGNLVVALNAGNNVTDPNFSTGTVIMTGMPLGTEPQRVVAENFGVSQNYPNPFNPTTEIPVTLSRDSRVALDVYDVVGQLVSHEEQVLPAGSHALTVDGSRWASGIYFARVSAGSQQRVLKMNLLK